MAEPTLQQVFGQNATQTETELVISKADFSAIGLTATSDNTAETLLAAIIAFAQNILNQANQELNPEQSVLIEDSLDSLTTRNDLVYRQKTKSISFEKVDTQSDFIPNDY